MSTDGLDRRQLLTAGLALTLSGNATAHKADPAPTVSHWTGRFGGVSVRYTALVETTILPAPDGSAALGTMVTTCYLRDGIGEPAQRPVLFLFNGGPGASSTPLHFSGIGPFRRMTPPGSDTDVLVANPLCPLDYVDLVFIDPIGTGFSRPETWPDGKAFWSVEGDAAATIAFIENWCVRHGRTASPRYMCGESYGTIRAATMLNLRPDMRFDGTILISPLINGSASAVAPGNDLAPVFWLPSMAMVAAFHGVTEARSLTPEACYELATRFATSDYIAALIQGSALPATQAARVAANISQLIGLPADVILAASLRPTPEQFWDGVLAARSLRTGRLDGRATGRLDAPKKPSPFDDPSLNKGGDGRPSRVGYFRDKLGYRDDVEYRSLGGDFRSKWIWTRKDDDPFYSDLSQYVGAAMRRSSMRLMVVGGYYDLATPILAAQHAVSHADIPTDRLTVRRYAAGHSVLDDVEVLQHFAVDLRRMIVRRT